MAADGAPRRAGRGRPRKDPRSDGGDPRAEIVAAASRLFARRGIGATPMSEIAAEAGLGPSSLYYWFGSKQEILELIITDVNRVPLEMARRLMAEPGRPATRLYRLIRADVMTLCSLPFDINEVHRLAGEDEHTFTRYWEERQLLNDAVETLIAQGVEAGDLLPVDPRLAALTVLANDEAVQNWWRPVAGRRLAERPDPDGGDYRTEEIATFMADLTVRGLLADAGGIDAVRTGAHPT